MRVRATWGVWVLLLGVLAGPWLRAQEGASGPVSAAQPAESTDVPSARGVYTFQQYSRLVVLDAVVTDRKGNVVTGLRKESFRVEESGEEQTVLHFEGPADRSPTQGLPIHSTADLDRLAPQAPVNIVVLDEFNTRFEDMAFARYSLKKFLERQPETLASPTMLVAVTLQNFTVLQDYTQDKTALMRALEHHLAAYPWQVHQFAWVGERFAAAFAAISLVAQATVGHPGHKNMIWLGRGFPGIDLVNVALDSRNRVDSAVQMCVNQLRDARVTLYSVDPAGVMIDPSVYGTDFSGTQALDPFGGNYTFTKLVQATGGRSFHGRNDVDAEIGTGIRNGTDFYSLSYRPTDLAQDPRRFRSIRLTLPEHPEYTVTTRQGYYRERPPLQVTPESPSRALAFELQNAATTNLSYDGVRLALTHAEGDADSFRIEIEPTSLRWTEAAEGRPRAAVFVVMSTQFDKKGKVLNISAKQITAQATGAAVPAHGPLQRGVTVDYQLVRDPKAVRVRFVVRVGATGRIGSAETLLTRDLPAVPAAAAGR